jgi:hypothetical protein
MRQQSRELDGKLGNILFKLLERCLSEGTGHVPRILASLQ